MEIDNDDDKLYKGKQSSSIGMDLNSVYKIRIRLINYVNLFRNKLVKGDKGFVLRLILGISLVVFLWNWVFHALFYAESQSIYQIVEANKANLNFFNDPKLHEYLNSKISQESIGFGFGKANTKDLAKKRPGTSPVIVNPGIYKYLGGNEVKSSETKEKSLLKSLIPSFKTKRKIYVILGKSSETGINDRKPKERWLLEKFSILNKIHYSKKFNYELIIMNNNDYGWQNIGLNQKKYKHEHREGWEKFDILRKVMKETSGKSDPDVEEWFWYVDLMTLIMEPDLSLDDIIFNKLEYIYRDLNYFNPNNLLIDDQLQRSNSRESKDSDSIDLILTQDCEGINLNSFLMKKSQWSNLLLDIIFDPVMYKQMHVKWAKSTHNEKSGLRLNDDSNKYKTRSIDIEEKNCLEYLFNTQSWIRSKIGFMPIRSFNSLSKDFCRSEEDDLDDEDMELEKKLTNKKDEKLPGASELNHDYLENRESFYYNETDRDFLINFVNCEQLHNCWDRFQEFSLIYNEIHKSWYQKLFG